MTETKLDEIDSRILEILDESEAVVGSEEDMLKLARAISDYGAERVREALKRAQASACIWCAEDVPYDDGEHRLEHRRGAEKPLDRPEWVECRAMAIRCLEGR